MQWLCIGWILGVACMGRMLLQLHIGLAVVMLSFVVFLIVSQWLRRLQFKPFVQLLIGLLSLILGVVLGHGYANQTLQQRLNHVQYAVDERDIIVYVNTLNQLGTNSIQQKVEVLQPIQKATQWLAYIPVVQNIPIEKSKKAKDKPSPTQINLQLGHYYRLNGKLRPAQSYATAGAFDQEKWYIQQNMMTGFRVKSAELLTEQQVYALGFAAQIQQHQRYGAKWQLWVERQRLELRNFIQQQPLRHKGLLLALLTGDKSLLNPQITADFQRFGMSHLLAISGPHVLIFAILVSWLLQILIAHYCPRLYLTWPKQYLLIVPFLLCVLMYCAFVGFEIPAMRTLLTCCIGSLFLVTQNSLRPFQLLLWSASALLIFDPFSILSAAFWLSFGACFILLRIYQTVQQQNLQQGAISYNERLYAGLKVLIESQWKIFLGLFPLMIVFFKQIAWITPLSNLIAIPWIGLVIVPLDLIAALAFFIFEPLSSLLFQLNDGMVGILLGCMHGIDTSLSPTLIPVALNSGLLAAVVFAIVIVFLPRGVVPKTWAVIAMVPLCFIRQQSHPFELNVLDVAQGQAIFIQQNQNSLMVDMGGNYDESKFSIGQQVIRPFLSVNGVASLDQLVLTHLDQDHSGSYESIKQDFKIQQVYSNEQVDVAAGSTFEYCQQGQKWQWSPQVSIEVLLPEAKQLNYAKYDKNENSCVLYVQVKNAQPYQSFLLMGDAGWHTEYQLLQHYPNLKVDVLVLGHHGSRHSSAYDFLRKLKPKLAIASAGKFNRYGHPSVVTQSRLKELGIPLLTTIEQGSIQFIQQPDGQMKLNFARDARQWLKRDLNQVIP